MSKNGSDDKTKVTLDKALKNLGEAATTQEVNAYLKGYRQAYQDLLEHFSGFKRKEG